jgi:hypothetical protein
MTQVGQYPPNTNYQPPSSPEAIIYGKTVWGNGKISSVEKPAL